VKEALVTTKSTSTALQLLRLIATRTNDTQYSIPTRLLEAEADPDVFERLPAITETRSLPGRR
jgi:hypothetical protein